MIQITSPTFVLLPYVAVLLSSKKLNFTFVFSLLFVSLFRVVSVLSAYCADSAIIIYLLTDVLLFEKNSKKGRRREIQMNIVISQHIIHLYLVIQSGCATLKKKRNRMRRKR